MEVSDQLHASATLCPGEGAPSIHWKGSWVGPRASLNMFLVYIMTCSPLSQWLCL